MEVVLRKKPGERQAAVAKLPAGTVVVIEREDGRWLRVRAGNRVGYLTRTTVADGEPKPATPPPPVADAPASIEPRPEPRAEGPTQRWSVDRVKATRAGSSGLFVGVTAASATLHADKGAAAAKLAQVERGTRLAVIDATDPGWIHVRDDAGRDGWIARADVDNGTASVAIVDPAVPATAVAASATTVRPPSGRFVARASAAVGYRSLGVDFTSNSTAGLANYLVSADAAAADAELDLVAKLSSRLRLGIDGRVQLGTSSPGSGIEYQGPSRAGGKIPFSTFAADAGVRIGMRAKRVFELALRGGIHYDAFIARDLDNAGKLPREQLVGATLGARVGIIPPASRVNVDLRIDVLALGSRGQTAGLEDGASSTADAVWAGATTRILLRDHLSFLLAYDFGRATTEWSGMSVRTGATAANRVDSTQTVQIGLAAEL